MIFGMIGSNPYPFNRLNQCLSRLALERNERVIVQAGLLPGPKGCESFDFAPRAKILEYIELADAVIMQGGYGSCLDVLSLGKTPIIMPRLIELAESNDDQTELTDFLVLHNVAIRVDSFKEIIDAVELVRMEKSNSHVMSYAIGRDLGEFIRLYLNL